MSIPENSAASLMGLRAGTCEGGDDCPRPATTSYGGIPCCSRCKPQLARECAATVAPLRESAQTALARAAAESAADVAELERAEAETRKPAVGLPSAAAIVHAAPVAPVAARSAPIPAQPPPPKPAPVVAPLVRATPLATVSAPPVAGRRAAVPVVHPDPDRPPTKQAPKTPQAITRFLAYIRANPGQNAQEIMAATGFSRATVNWCACELRRKGKLAPAVKYGRWAYGRYYPNGHDVPTHAHPGTVMSRVLKAIVENPGITQAEIKRTVTVGNSVATAVWHLRCAGLVDPVAHPYSRRLYAAGCTPMDKPMDNTQQPASKA